MSWDNLISLPAIDTGLSYLDTILSIAVLLRLWHEGLYRVYKAFTALVLFDVTATLILLALPYHTYGYALYWMAFEAGKLLLYAMVALELYEVALRPYPGILRAGRIAVRVSLVAATVISMLMLQVDLSRIQTFTEKVLPYFFTVQHGIIFTLAAFQILVLIFLLWFPIRLSRNARLYATLYILFFTAKSTALLAIILFGRQTTRLASIGIIAVHCACLTAWALLLRRSGEDVATIQPLGGPRPEPIELTEKLEAINALLSGSDKEKKQ